MTETNTKRARDIINNNYTKLKGLGQTKRLQWFAKRRYGSI